MHIFFSGIGGAGIGPLALIAHQAGFEVSGSDKQHNSYIDYLAQHGVTNVTIGQSEAAIAAVQAVQPIDWYVYSSALPKENQNHPELQFVEAHHIKHSKRDEFLNYFLQEKHLKMLAVAGTHGKTTTTAMLIWLLKQLDEPLSYTVGAKLSFGDMGEYHSDSTYFAYECDEYDRNFLSFQPYLSIISGIDWDHADIYPTREEYNQAFAQFISQSTRCVLWDEDVERLQIEATAHIVLQKADATAIALAGKVNRENAWQVVHTVHQTTGRSVEELTAKMSEFPGVSRRFEKISENLFTDYAHTPKKIEGALQLAHEVAGDKVVVVYEGLHNTRQHFIKNQLEHMFDSVKTLYIVPSYLAREDPNLALLTPKDLAAITSQPEKAHPAELNDDLKKSIEDELAAGNLVICLTAGGGGSLDEWLRKSFVS